MAAKEPERTPNFSPGEKECLFNLCVRYSSILEDKKTNRVTIEDKNTTWKKIEAEFNNIAPLVCHRNSDQLRRLYENKKKELRKKMADHKKESFLTGGGPLPDMMWNPIDEILISIVNEKSVSGTNREFVCDSDEPMSKKTKPSANSMILEFSSVVYTLNDIDEGIIRTDTQPASNNLSSFQSPNTLKNLEPYFNKENLDSDEVNLSATRNLTTDTPRTKPKSSDRRRPQTGVRALTSSDIAEKYNVLLDRRLVLVNNQINEDQNFSREEHKQKIILLKQQTEIAALEKEEKKMKVELLKLEVVSKKSILGNI